MSSTLEQLSSEIRGVLKKDSSETSLKQICGIVSKALLDQDFVAKHVTPEECKPRKVLYEDPDLGFCICGHVYLKPIKGSPHDHGSTWAVYGVAEGATEMSDWTIVSQGEGKTPTLVEFSRSYELKPGDCHYYQVGSVHSPNTQKMTKLIRVEGQNLDRVQRSNIKISPT